MKKLAKMWGIIAIVAVIGVSVMGCKGETEDGDVNAPKLIKCSDCGEVIHECICIPPVQNQNPVASDFIVGNLTQTAGSVTAVTITPQTGKSTGTITIFYNGSETLPTTAGSYTVTFNIVEAEGWNAANGLNGGTLIITNTGISSGNTVINIATIQGVTVPVTGATPMTAITPSAQYTGTIAWNPVHTTFAASTDYTATITLTANEGFTLQGVSTNFFTVEGTKEAATNSANSGVITAKFPKTGGTTFNPTIINIAAIHGVTEPVTGATPVTAITPTAQYSGTVTWNPAHTTFAASTDYTATITLTANEGFTLQGVSSNFFTVEGTKETATNSANSGVITAKFPKTAASITELIIDTWAEGNIIITNSEQWFKFIATADSHYIHFNSGTLNYIYVQLYDLNDTPVSTQTLLHSSVLNTQRTLIKGIEYKIKVTPYANFTGTYNIGYTTSIIRPNTEITTLIANTWADGNFISTSGEQWFKFTATAATQYLHFNPGTLNYAYIQLYDDKIATVGSNTILYSSVLYTTRSVSIGREYYIKVTPYNGSGSYMLGFNTSTSKPTKMVTNISIKSQPTKTNYTHNEYLDLTGLIVTLTYYDTTTEDVAHSSFTSKNIIANPSHNTRIIFSTHNEQNVTITYGSFPSLSTISLNVSKAAGNFGNPSIINTTYAKGLKLRDLTLPDGYVFDEPDTLLYAGNNQTFSAIYTDPSDNFLSVNGSIRVNVARAGPASWPTASTITYGSPLSASVLNGGDTAAGTFAWTNSSTFPTVTNNGYNVNFTPFDNTNYLATTNTVSITVNKTVGGAVNTPTLSRYAHNRIIINSVTNSGTGQSAEYGISTSSSILPTTWQTGLVFSDLNTGTTYYIFSRAAENANYNAGTANGNLQVTTRISNTLTVSSTTDWNDALSHIAAFGDGTISSPQTYTIVVNGDVSISGGGKFGNTSNILVIINGNGKLFLTSNGNIISIAANQTVYIDSANLVLQGLTNNNSSLVSNNGMLELRNGTIRDNNGGGVSGNGTFKMSGGTITGNTSTSSSSGGGITTGSFTMSGGTISNNSVNSWVGYGGGVYVNGTFIMTGGNITSNTITSSSDYNARSYGGGVYVNGDILMSGGNISSNSITSNAIVTSTSATSNVSYGGGVYVTGNFTMENGVISNNTSRNYGSVANWYGTYGGGVYANTFTMYGGSISENTTSSSMDRTYGGGVYANTFTIYGGTIDNNTSRTTGNSYYTSYGGGVCAVTFNMEGGTIYGNKSNSNGVSYGGGVFASNSFIKIGGTIYGNDSTSMNNNEVIGTSSYGHAVSYGNDYYRDSTLLNSDNLYSSAPLPAVSGQSLSGWIKK